MCASRLCLLLICGASLPFAFSQPAAADDHFWSFRPLARPAVPQTQEESVSGLDAFVLSRLEAGGLDFAPEADRRTLCRRVYLDLIGLPPSPEEMREFLADETPEAYPKLVERLLSSSQYGERWGRQWLDVVGYADSNGYIRHDSPRPLAYRYRDYVIQSLNEDKPYDQFWREQLAGDEMVDYHAAETLSPADLQTLIATHYLRNAPDGTDNTEGNAITRTIERYAVLESLLQITMSSMFGMTIDCARCHDHKFDPIPQQDYYALQAVFYPAFNVKEWTQPNQRSIHAAGKADLAAWKTSQDQANREIAALQNGLQEWVAAHRPRGRILLLDDFAGETLTTNWSATAPGDSLPANAPLTKLDAESPPAARIRDGKLSVFATGGADTRWVVTKQAFDWTPDAIGEWIQVTFDLTASGKTNGTPAERVGFYIAMHDANDDSPTPGGNILFDGNPAGSASVILDYPGSDQQGLGQIGTTGYLPGRNFGVRVTRTGDDAYSVEHLVDGRPEEKTLTLKREQLPDGGFGFELCCGRDFTVDNVTVESLGDEGELAKDRAEWAAYSKELQQRQQKMTAGIAAANSRRLPEPEKIAWASDLSAAPPEVPLLTRGDYFQPGDNVSPGVLSALADNEASIPAALTVENARTTGRRLAFANWATKPNSRAAALLARVQADRIWRGHFGRGLVPSPENFGASGVGPTHPELLEWLASEFVAAGWKQKPLHRMIVLSQTYRQTGSPTEQSLERDAANSLYSRFPVHRLEAEQIRDSMLAVAGVLNRTAGGPAVNMTDRGDRQIVTPTPDGPGPHEVDRRSIYLNYRRSTPLTFLRAFDQASPDPNCVVRGSSTAVAQSLALLNGDFAIRMGREFARRIEQRPSGDNVSQAFEIALGRPPSDEESAASREFLSRPQSSVADLCRLLMATNEFLYLP